MKIYVSEQQISNRVYTRLYRMPLNIRVEPTYWLPASKKYAFIPLKHSVELEDISFLKYLWLLFKYNTKI